MPENVVYGGAYIRFIKSKIQPILTETEVKTIASSIESGRLTPSIKTHRTHVKHVKKIVEDKQRSLDENLCPKCGNPMVLRKTRSGVNQGKQFWGCSGFPKCRMIRQIP
nr:topoisomerase DNA-binding C4 zinc finger domain-containing protein [Methylomarinum sp. Ch1-1]MDP4519434.1 topoisomerase DNA-binding C4 zinc finger domain-containing protein [Methylomarinum sp. Ch1-1]